MASTSKFGKYLAGISAAMIKDNGISIVSDVASFGLEYPDHNLSPRHREDLEAAIAVLNRVEGSGGASDRLHMVKCMLMGKLGRFDEVIALASSAYAKNPNWHNAIAAAKAFLRSGQREQAIEMFRTAASHDPKDVTAFLEIGDLHLNAGEWKSSLAAYELALERDLGNAWAEPSAYYCQYKITGDNVWLKKLTHETHGEGCTCGMHSMITQLVGGYSSQDRKDRAEYLLGLENH